MLDAYHLNKEETDIKEAKQMSQPIVIQRLFILKDTIEEEYLDKKTIVADENPKKEEDTSVEEFLNWNCEMKSMESWENLGPL